MLKPSDSISGYAAQQSQMSVVPGSIQARITFVRVSRVLSGTGTRNVLPDPRSTPARHPLALNWVSRMVFSPTELALVDLNGLVRTAGLLRAALLIYQQCLSSEHTTVCKSVITEVMFALDLVGRFAAQDVVRKVQNLLEGVVTAGTMIRALLT